MEGQGLIEVTSLSLNESPFNESHLKKLKDEGARRLWARSPFQVDKRINERLVIYVGDYSKLKAQAFVNPTNENLTQLDLIRHLAGPELDKYMRLRLCQCSTGGVKLTPGFKSNYEHILHAVPPKYQSKYKTAAESALFHTYFRILETLISKRIRTVVMPTLSTPKCNLPFEENLQMQLRIIRRMLEKKLDHFDRIVIPLIFTNLNGSCLSDTSPGVSCDSRQQVTTNGKVTTTTTNTISTATATTVDELYKLADSLYWHFPRNELDEELACYKLEPQTIGGPNGEPLIPEREIRIKRKPARCKRNISSSKSPTAGAASPSSSTTTTPNSSATRCSSDRAEHRNDSYHTATRTPPQIDPTTTTTTTTKATEDAHWKSVGVDENGNERGAHVHGHLAVHGLGASELLLDDEDEEPSIDLSSGLDLSTVVGKTPFSQMRGDLDAELRLRHKQQQERQLANLAPDTSSLLGRLKLAFMSAYFFSSY